MVPHSVAVQQKALAATAVRRSNSHASEPEYPPISTAQPVVAGPWGETARLESLRQKLLEKEAERIASMSPERLQLVAMLDEHNVRLESHVIDALINWKYHG